MSRKARKTSLPPPFLKRVWLPGDAVKVESDWDDYPLSLPIIHSGGFDITFEKSVTIIVGENGSGKSTLLEAIASMAGSSGRVLTVRFRWLDGEWSYE
jgi:predicted ATPase